jgi:hypothetical protein
MGFANYASMKSTVLASLFCWAAGFAHGGAPQIAPVHLASAANVNSRYTVESVEVTGFDGSRIADPLRNALHALVGTACDPNVLEDLSRQLRKQLHAKAVTEHLERGSGPDRVKVVFEVTRRAIAFDLAVPKFLYHSKQGASVQVEASTTVARNHNLMFGIVSDGDELTERYAGIQAAYENAHVGTDRVRFRMLFEDYHEQWNRATTSALANPALLSPSLQTDTPDTYRSRRNFQPMFSFAVGGPIILNAGVSAERMEENAPSTRFESANALVLGIQYRKRFEGTPIGEQSLDAGYDIRAASRVMGSNYIYTRHHWTATYNWTRGRHSVTDVVTGGYITGRAPLFERFVVGTSSLLRGWNRYDIDPLGGNRLIHNTIDYRYRSADVFYDAGSLWSSGKAPALRHSVGIGIHQSVFTAAVAFPIRDGRIWPVLLLGMNY